MYRLYCRPGTQSGRAPARRQGAFQNFPPKKFDRGDKRVASNPHQNFVPGSFQSFHDVVWAFSASVRAEGARFPHAFVLKGKFGRKRRRDPLKTATGRETDLKVDLSNNMTSFTHTRNPPFTK